jgi:hypothetical protein
MDKTDAITITWTDYMRHRTGIRGFDLGTIEKIIRYSTERYFDKASLRSVIVGKHDNNLVLIPYDKTDNEIIPVTVHATTRQQINFRLKTGRYVNE